MINWNKRNIRILMVIGSLFVGTISVINLLGVTRFIDFSFSIGNHHIPFLVPLGVLLYTLALLLIDLVSEFYDRKLANRLIMMGLLINFWVAFIVWMGGHLPPHAPLDPITNLPPIDHPDYAFFRIRLLTLGTVVGSMVAYATTQFIDVYLFQAIKRLTKGKYLWLRFNGSMLITQLLDTFIVSYFACFITHALPHIDGVSDFQQFIVLVFSSYLFKVLISFVNIIPFYLLVISLKSYINKNDDKISENPGSGYLTIS